MEKSSVKQNNGGSSRISKQTKLYALLGFAVGCLFTSVKNTAGFLQEYQIATSCEMSLASHSNVDADRASRFSKYFQNYRYILPSNRDDIFKAKLPADECGSGPDFDKWWKLGHKDGRSRVNEDKIIYETFFKNQTSDFKGTYVELGAFDGFIESNTRFFDICLGWKGLLIEGNPINYQRAVANRPYAHKMSLAPSCSAEYGAMNKMIPFYIYPQTNVGLVGKAQAYENKTTVDVPCGPLSPILEDVFAENSHAGLPTLDFFSLDVEGAEALVLSTIDFQAIRINILMIETVNTFCRQECEVRDLVRAKMADEGYKRYENLVKFSDVYVHPESPFQIPSYVAMPM